MIVKKTYVAEHFARLVEVVRIKIKKYQKQSPEVFYEKRGSRTIASEKNCPHSYS